MVTQSTQNVFQAAWGMGGTLTLRGSFGAADCRLWALFHELPGHANQLSVASIAVYWMFTHLNVGGT